MMTKSVCLTLANIYDRPQEDARNSSKRQMASRGKDMLLKSIGASERCDVACVLHYGAIFSLPGLHLLTKIVHCPSRILFRQIFILVLSLGGWK